MAESGMMGTTSPRPLGLSIEESTEASARGTNVDVKHDIGSWRNA
jgi:hypothetical protein